MTLVSTMTYNTYFHPPTLYLLQRDEAPYPGRHAGCSPADGEGGEGQAGPGADEEGRKPAGVDGVDEETGEFSY